MAQAKTNIVDYQGNCHCGAIKFHVSLAKLIKATKCTCKFCSKKGILWTLLDDGVLKFERGEFDMRVYQFGTKTRQHNFCSICGTHVFSKNTGEPDWDIGLNVRTLMDLDVWSLEVEVFDGANVWKSVEYKAPDFNGPTPSYTSEDKLKTYDGSCHCGNIRLSLLTPPLPQCEVKSCNCSICIRNASIFLYPKKSQVSITGLEHSTSYPFNRKFVEHVFCSRCGVATHSHVLGPPKEVQARWSEEVRQKNAKNFDMVPINLRVFEGVEWDDLKITREDSIGDPPVYKVD